MNPEKAAAFKAACEEWTKADQSWSRWTAIKEFVAGRILIPFFETIGAHGMAYKLGGFHNSRSKPAYLCSRWRTFGSILGAPARGARLLKRWALALIKLRKPREPWEKIVQQSIQAYIRSQEVKIVRNAKILAMLKEQAELGTHVEMPGLDHDTAESLNSDLQYFGQLVVKPSKTQIDYSDPMYDE